MDETLVIQISGLLHAALIAATPIALGAYCGVFCERAGVVNIAIEGMMLVSAMAAQLFAQYGGQAFAGTALQPYTLQMATLAGIFTGGLMGGLHALLSIRFKVDQIISGAAINIAAVGITGALYNIYLQGGAAAGVPVSPGTYPVFSIPVVKDIPVIGVVLFQNQPVVYAMLILTLLSHYIIFMTPWGLRTRTVGEHPRAADTLGVNVFRIRYVNVMIGGALAGLAGTWFTLEWVGVFNLLMTGGRGFISLAAVIFGKWTFFGSFGAALIFGLAQALQIKLQIGGSAIPYQFLIMAPYILTMLVLAGFVGRAVPPKADGVPYEK